MTSGYRLIYGYDTLCGWCYGLIPALRHFREIHPDVAVDVLPGGLNVGHMVMPYSGMVDHINQAAPGMTAVTGQPLGRSFFDLIKGANPPVAASAPPAHAVLQMAALAPGRAVEFAHLLQEAHFAAGKDVNLPATYVDICSAHGLPELDTDAIANARETTPLVRDAFARSRRLGIQSFPTCLVSKPGGEIRGAIQGVYEPGAFVEAYEKLCG